MKKHRLVTATLPLLSACALGLTLSPNLSFADAPAVPAEVPSQTQRSPLKEIGLTLGTPALGNIVLGYWSENESFPWIARISGMDYGSLRGIQADFGWKFYARGRFKQFIALSVSTSHYENNYDNGVNENTYFQLGVGPTYGLNLYGFTAQAGLVAGTYTIYHSYDGTTDTASPVQLVGQIGYSLLW